MNGMVGAEILPMNKIILMFASVLLSLFLTSCATQPPPQVFHNTDSTALILKSLDSNTSQMLRPSTSNQAKNDQILAIAKALPQHQTAVVMLENYNEQRLGEQFRDRSLPLFICLRDLGYQHIIFVQGREVSDPNGLTTLAEYY
jgi:outer membrane PBP1 activator LpoA protein